MIVCEPTVSEPLVVSFVAVTEPVVERFPAVTVPVVERLAAFTEPLVERFAAAKSILNRHAPLLEQTVLCEFIEAGHFGRHLRRMREMYSERLGVLLEEGRRQLKGVMEISEIEAGLQTMGWLAKGIDAKAVAKAAFARGVETIPLEGFYRSAQELEKRERDGLQMGFAAVTPREIRRGVEELAHVIEGMRLNRSVKEASHRG